MPQLPAGLEDSGLAEQPKHVGIWIRVSTEDQARSESPEHHERRARAYAEAKGWTVVETYDLAGVSGKAVMEHPEAKRMLDDIARGRISALIFSKLARLARSTKELLEFAEFFRKHDAGLISLQEAIDTTTPSGRLFYTMIAAMAQWEREEIAERVAVSVPVRAKLGRCLGGQASFGYQWKDSALVPHPDEAPVRKLLFELFREHGRLKTTARLLNERGYRTRNGSPFSDTTVERLIRDPTAKGQRRANYTRSNNRGKAWELKPERDWVFTDVEPIVPEELWNECNAILDDRRKHRPPPARRPVHLFAGVAACHCGAKMYVPSNSPKYICKACRNKIPVKDLEAVFQERLKDFFFSPEEIAGYLSEADAAIEEKEALLRSLEQERLRIKADIDKIYALYLADKLTMDDFGIRHQPLADRLRAIEGELPELQAQTDILRIDTLSREEIVSDARDLYSRWFGLPHDERRRVVETIVDRIVISDDAVDIHLHYLPSVNRDGLATRPQGFMAATSCTRAG